MHRIIHGLLVLIFSSQGSGRRLHITSKILPRELKLSGAIPNDTSSAGQFGLSKSLTALAVLLLSFNCPASRWHHKVKAKAALGWYLVNLQHSGKRLPSAATALASIEHPPSLPGGDSYARGSLGTATAAWWRQTPSDFQLVCQLPNGVSVKRDVSLDLHKQTINIHIAGISVVEGQLPHNIIVDESDWFVEDSLHGFDDGPRYLIVDLHKAKPYVDWSGPLADTQKGDPQSQGVPMVSSGHAVETSAELRVQSSTSNVKELQAHALRLSPSCLSAAAIAELDASDLVVLPNFISPAAVAALRQDHMALRARGLGKVLSGDRSSEELKLPLNGVMPQRDDDGGAAEFLSTQLVPTLMSGLAPLASIRSSGQVPTPFMDIASLGYLHYEPGGYFLPHLDTGDGQDPSHYSRRIFSFVLFLTDIDEWDGGALRLFAPLSEAEQQRQAGDNRGSYEIPIPPVLTDVQPKAGTMVIFRSAAIVHEVCEAHVPRNVLAGWLHRAK